MTMFMNRKAHYIKGINDVYYRLHIIPFKIPVGFYIVLGNLILKLIWKAKGRAKIYLKTKNG